MNKYKRNATLYINGFPLTEKIINKEILKKNHYLIFLENDGVYDEKDYYEDIKKLFKRLSTVNRSFIIKIAVNNRKLFNHSNILNEIPDNIKLRIKNNEYAFYTYDVKEYLREEKLLNLLLLPIKNKDLSPLEKYIKVYNLVKNYKPYKKAPSYYKPCVGRAIPYVLNKNNRYMVCSGYAILLKELLNKVDIPCRDLIVYVDHTKDKGYNRKKDKPTVCHQRSIVYINDDKYNVHGIYLSDPTWDNNNQNDKYLNCLLTFDRKKDARHLEELEAEDLLLDFHDFDEFKLKLNYYIKFITDYFKTNEETKDKYIENTYGYLFDQILELLQKLDYNEYKKLYNKYYKQINCPNKSVTELEKITCEMLTEYAEYIIPLSNNPIDFKTIIKVAIKLDNNPNRDDLKLTTYKNTCIDIKSFPYSYDYNIKKEGYLTPKRIKVKRKVKKEN